MLRAFANVYTEQNNVVNSNNGLMNNNTNLFTISEQTGFVYLFIALWTDDILFQSPPSYSTQHLKKYLGHTHNRYIYFRCDNRATSEECPTTSTRTPFMFYCVGQSCRNPGTLESRFPVG